MKQERTDLRLVFSADTEADKELIGLVEKFTDTEEGYLQGRAVVTNVGVFPYRTKEGVRYELRPPEEVFHEDSLKSLSMKPLTDDHPDKMVNADNAKDLHVGHLGDVIGSDAYRVSAKITVTDAKTVQKIKAGKRALSCGYSCDVEMKGGNWMGIDYDAIQRNIRYNHVAIVDAGRAGDEAVMRFDSKGGFQAPENEDTQQKENATMKAFKFDNKEYTEESDVILALGELKNRADEAEKEKEELSSKVSGLEGERDSLKDEVAQLKEKLDKAPAEIEAAVQARVQLLAVASKHTDTKEGTNDELRNAVILKAFPKADLADRGEAYLQARFDAAVEMLEQVEKVDTENKAKTSSKNDATENRADDARAKYMAELKNAYNKKEA